VRLLFWKAWAFVREMEWLRVYFVHILIPILFRVWPPDRNCHKNKLL